MARYSEKQKAALEALMKDDVHRHAMEIIKTEGLGGLTMERIAVAVGVSRGTLYNYFADKEAVISFVKERTFDPVLRAIEEVAVSDLDPGLKLAKIADWIFTAVYNDSALIIALSPTKHDSKNRESELERRNQGMRVIEDIIRDGIETGTFRKLSPVVVTEVFIGSIFGMIESMSLSGEFYRANAVVPTLMDLYLGGLRAPAQ
jgi:AcrR family transcriptional regulator